MDDCLACGCQPQLRLFLCFDCWRLLDPEWRRRWCRAKTLPERVAVATLALQWADGYAAARRTAAAGPRRADAAHFDESE